MPFNGSGTFTIVNTFVANTTILSAAVNQNFTDIATGLSDCLTRDGQAPMTAELKIIDGTAGSPGFGFNADSTTGLYRIGSGQIGVTLAGSLSQTFQAISGTTYSSGLLGTTGAIYVPIGSITDFAGASAPTGWFFCNGQSLSQPSYPELFAVIGTTFGGTSVNYALPDLMCRARYGRDGMGTAATSGRITSALNFVPSVVGNSGGSQSHTLAQTELPNVNFTNSGITLNDPQHSHSVTLQTDTNHLGAGAGSLANLLGGTTTTTTVSTGITISSQGHAASGGLGCVMSVLGPAMVFNTIIFAGRA